ncbi:2-hydroxyacid dehydrogenase [Cochlodiniinecator piscidefendens]|uniref:2-hydroxyacid dehydrogenase n=1 Tax=Cochlodiniinecator piscidefendens TaxID=2715756 RepID=UPI0014089CA7|nr:glyoxylate/hydroxypyruvate reductase A [Cochlodiniinecator piscidefendens]
MDILFIWDGGDTDRWAKALSETLGDVRFHVYPNVGDKTKIDYALVWLPPLGELKTYPYLKGIFSIGAGASHILRDPDLPESVPVVRLVDNTSVHDMWLYACHWILHYHRHFDLYQTHQSARTWDRQKVLTPGQRKVGVLGLGAIGGYIAQNAAKMGFNTIGWSRTQKEIDGVTCMNGDEGLNSVLRQSDILINMLPATPQTCGLLNRERLAMMPKGASLINMGRGDILDNAALIAALDSGALNGATLDVFDVEPLPQDNAFWSHPKVKVTPHAAGPTNEASAPHQIASDILRLEHGKIPSHAVNPNAGY